MNYWLIKSEPETYSWYDLVKLGRDKWDGVRNYAARNNMRSMKLGDLAFFYHSNCKNPGIVGVMKITKLAYPDRLQFQKNHKYFDPKSNNENPRWLCVDVTFIKKTPLLELQALRNYSELKSMKILQKGNRLSITPVTKNEWDFINLILTD